MVRALRRQWDRCPPIPIAVQRVSRFLGLKDTKPQTKLVAAAQTKALDEKSFEALRSVMPTVPAGFITEPMSPEEFAELYGRPTH